MLGGERLARGQTIARTLRRWLPLPVRRGAGGPADDDTAAPRPRRAPRGGNRYLVWCHADNGAGLAELEPLVSRLSEQGTAVDILLTTRGLVPDADLDAEFPAAIARLPCPSEDPTMIRNFLERWKPDAGIWVGSSYAPTLIAAAVGDGIAMINVNAGFAKNIWRRARVVRRALRQQLEQFDVIYGRDEAACEGLLKFGLPAARVRNTGRLAKLPPVPDYDETQRVQMARAVGNRPVWLACGVMAEELETVLEAYRDAARLTHRLLLVLRPRRREDAAGFAAHLTQADWSFVRRSEAQEPVFDTRIILDDSADELGLWLRIAPVCFLGNSLIRGGGTDPMDAAALGSAILHGPYVGSFHDAYGRLAEAGAAVQVRSAKSLAEAVCEISFPDRAAVMAHAAWQVQSQGADVVAAVADDLFALFGQTRVPA